MSTASSSVKANKMPATKTAKTAKPATETVAVPVVAPVATPVAATPVVTEVRTADAVLTSLQEALKTLKSDLTSRLAAVSHDLIEVSKAVKRELRDSKRRRKVDPATLSPEDRAIWEARRKNNAFLKPRLLTDEMCTFMGLPAKSQRSQTDVTKFVSAYVKEHNCFDPKFKRRIVPDTKLAKLLRTKDKDEVTYLNLQSFLKVHYVKTQ
jgi:chromatin remodeling complex protein RSC6